MKKQLVAAIAVMLSVALSAPLQAATKKSPGKRAPAQKTRQIQGGGQIPQAQLDATTKRKAAKTSRDEKLKIRSMNVNQ